MYIMYASTQVKPKNKYVWLLYPPPQAPPVSYHFFFGIAKLVSPHQKKLIFQMATSALLWSENLDNTFFVAGNNTRVFSKVYRTD